jgi:2-iminobutanoate/2-iminopropanoate deaminase
MKKIIETDRAPAAVGPYSQAVRSGDLLFLSGQLGLDPASGALAGNDIETQTRQALENLCAILGSEGLAAGNIIKTTIYLADINDYKAMNSVYAHFFHTDPPARAAFQVAALPLSARVEIEAIAAYL